MQTSLSTNIRSCLVINQSATCLPPSPAPVPRWGCRALFREPHFNSDGNCSDESILGRSFPLHLKSILHEAESPSLAPQESWEIKMIWQHHQSCAQPIHSWACARHRCQTSHSQCSLKQQFTLKKIHSSRIIVLKILSRGSPRWTKSIMMAQQRSPGSPAQYHVAHE